VLKWDAGHNKWVPGTDNTGLTAVTRDGTLTGNGGGIPLGVNTSAIQARVSGSCSTGSTISAVNADGTVSCQTPPPVMCPFCKLQTVDLESANLAGAILTGADLSAANLMFANLSNAKLHGTILDADNLVFATLSNADLSNASLINADLTFANLIGAVGGGTANTAGVTWSNTTCPDGSNSATNGTSPQSCVGHGF
jgi:uncharacterized protein YjbI with pentapeptide repeats